MVGLVSAAGLIGLLSESDSGLRSFALKQLNERVDLLWPEIANSIGDIEALHEDEAFADRQLAAIVASKVYYHLQEYNESMAFALGAGKYFELDDPGEYEDTIISKCVDTFISFSNSRPSVKGSMPVDFDNTFNQTTDGAASMSASLTSPVTPFSQSVLPSKSLLSRQNTDVNDPTQGEVSGPESSAEMVISQRGLQKQLHTTIERLLEQCARDKRYKQIVGISIEARNLDLVRRAILRGAEDERAASGNGSKAYEELIEYVLDICMSVVQERGLRNEILSMILDLFNKSSSPNYFAITKCLVYLEQHGLASEILNILIRREDARSLAMAYQVSFDLYDNSTQEFLRHVREDLVDLLPQEETQGSGDKANEDNAAGQVEEQLQQELEDSAGTVAKKTKTASEEGPKLETREQKQAVRACCDILDGLTSIHLNVEFLNKSNRVDLTVLNKVKDSLEARNSIYHTAVTLATGFMHAKTANDNFFRDNLEWLGKAVNWSKFTATAALGVIHQGNINHVDRLLSPYFPKTSTGGPIQGSAYSQGGSLYAYGLVCANHRGKAVDFIREKFKENTDEVVQHGGALGLGVAGMALGDQAIYDDLKQVLYSDSAINGEAVGLSMGLIMLGSGNVGALSDMIQYAHDTQHEKIVRGLAMGMAMIMYGRQEAADEVIQGLLNDPDPTLRYGGIMTIALAYVGTGSNKAVRKLLHVAVSDVSDDVRRIAVLSLGFILFRKYSSVPRMVELLAESYNPHVRYGAAMALGISCAGTGLEDAIDLLEPMLKDPTDFVRQGALISLAMILVQQNDALNPKVSAIRKSMLKIIGDRHEDAMCKFGCAMALGIIDAGGRNCTISLQTQTGNLHMPGIVGMAVFIQYWYWFPLAHFLSLSFTPTSIIAVDQKLEVPVFNFHCNTRPSMFGYPPEEVSKVDQGPEKVKTAVLSTTARAKRRAARKEKQQKGDGMDLDPVSPVTTRAEKAEKTDTDEAGKDDEVEKKEEGEKKEEIKRKEKVGYEIGNMSRVLPTQLKYLSFPDTRYQPVKKPVTGGVLVVLDADADKDREIVPLTVSKKSAAPAAAAQTTGSTLPQGLGAVPETPARQIIGGGATEGGIGAGAGAAAAAGVLTAVDEDEEGGEEAPVPNDFDYETDGEGDEE